MLREAGFHTGFFFFFFFFLGGGIKSLADHTHFNWIPIIFVVMESDHRTSADL